MTERRYQMQAIDLSQELQTMINLIDDGRLPEDE